MTGDSSERFDLVFVGDGYTADDLDDLPKNVQSKWTELSAVEPFASYKDYFNVWQVNVVSRRVRCGQRPDQSASTGSPHWTWASGAGAWTPTPNACCA